jgi:alanine racemase
VIDLDALRANFAELRRHAAGQSVIAVVKADAYGHGAPAVSRALVAAGAERLAVALLSEAAQLRSAGVAVPVIVLGGVHDVAEAEDALALHAIPALQHEGQLALLARVASERGVRFPVHVEIDTGMRRMGVSAEDAPGFLERVAQEPALTLQGVFTHLACADEGDASFSLEQLGRFAGALAAARERGVQPGLVHVANSAALLAGEKLREALAQARAVRPGLALYGVSPAAHCGAALRPAMTLQSRVVQVRRLRAGEAVGYGATWRAQRPSWLATLPLGYGDGVPWSLGNRGCVLLAGRRLPIVGRVSMDFLTVDAGDIPVEVGDEAVIFGSGRDGDLPVVEVAAAAGTIAYELLVRVGARVPRVMLG